MKYDFDKIVPRAGSDCAKWDATGFLYGSPDVIPMWVADMDFEIADPITEALARRIDHRVYGYSVPIPSAAISRLIVERLDRKYGWKIEPQWLVFTNGIVPALHFAVKAFTHPGDGVVIQEPVYYPFFSAVRSSGCRIRSNPLPLSNGRYQIDFEDLERCFGPDTSGLTPESSRTKMMILCNPHNPSGRVWNPEELRKVGEIALANDAVMVSDEIHCELLFEGVTHTPFAVIAEEFEQNSVVCMAPSKTFNLAGLQTSFLIIPNPKLRQRYRDAVTGFMPWPNVLGLAAMEAAFREGDEWLEQLLEYLQGNLDLLRETLREKVPGIEMMEPDGTYLIWLDCRGLGLARKELQEFLAREAKVGLEPGHIFGRGGEGFMRMNIACARSLLTEALQRIEDAVGRL